MKKLLIVVLILLSACGAPMEKPGTTDASEITVWHDKDRNVTCYVFRGYSKGGISCIPDWQLKEPR